MDCRSRYLYHRFPGDSLVWIGFRDWFRYWLYDCRADVEKEGLPPAWIDSLLIYTMLGTVIGARLGHCLFYAPEYYLANPIEIFKIWEGGLASHGGTLGIIIAIYFYSKRVSHKSMLWAFDKLVVPTGLVAAMIRLGNLMNHEITVIPLICLGDFVLSIIYTHGEWGRSLFLPLRAIRRNCMRPLVIW